jgi:hypothetical protein
VDASDVLLRERYPAAAAVPAATVINLRRFISTFCPNYISVQCGDHGFRAVQISGKILFFGMYFLEKIKTGGAYETKLPEDFRSTDPSATTWYGSANLHFVIPSEAGFPATLHWTQPRVRFSVGENRMKSANAIKINRKSGLAEGPAVRLDVKQRPYQ